MTPLSDTEFKRRMMACWLGKAVGGTLGMPFEGIRHCVNLSYYDPVPTEMLPNDDLDAQVVYAFLLDQMATPRVDRHVLSQAWAHVGQSTDEYGIVKRNLRLGLKPPATGSYDNAFTRGMGAAIRTELWACLAAGDPDLAVKYAYEDACMDHAGEGIHAAVFLAALQSMAFIEHDRETLLTRALKYLPADSELLAALNDTRKWWVETNDWREVQRRVADRYLNDNFTDVVINLSYILLGWLAGKDFGEAICIAVNCGQDTDCTGATLGALLGILNPDGIEERWLKPIGKQLVLSPSITGVKHPPTLDGFTEQVARLAKRINRIPPSVSEDEQPVSHLAIRAHIGGLAGELPTRLPAQLNLSPRLLPETWIRLPVEPWMHDQLVVRYRLNIRQPQRVHLMFCTPSAVRVWWNNKLVITSEGGAFVPAFHRCVPEDQVVPLDLTAGSHEVTAILRIPGDAKQLEWVIGLGDNQPAPGCREWIDDPFDRPNIAQARIKAQGATA